LQMWASHIEKMICLDNREASDIEAVVRWCQSADSKVSEFWSNSILCTETLRRQFDRLMLLMEADKTKIKSPEINQPLNAYKAIPKPVRTPKQKEEMRKKIQEAREKFL